jgi:hypothetical protein
MGAGLWAGSLTDRQAETLMVLDVGDVVANSDLVFPVRRLASDDLEAWKQVIERGSEGYVAKDEASPYEGEATRRWLKVKQKGCTVEKEQVEADFEEGRYPLIHQAKSATPTNGPSISPSARCTS